MPLPNPYGFEPAENDEFIARDDILRQWETRLTPDSEMWKISRNWMLIAPGGMGKTSLLKRMEVVARTSFSAWTLFIDIGRFCDLDSPVDFFEAIEAKLPPAKRIGTRVRQWIGLDPSASNVLLGSQVISLILRQAIAFSPQEWNGLGIEISGLEHKLEAPEGIAGRLAKVFNNLVVLSEQQDRPVVLIVDQAGKAYTSPRWQFIVEQLLEFAQVVRLSGTSNLVFVFSMRPERKGWLEYDVDRRLFSEDLFQYEDLEPFTFNEAVKAIMVRARGYISQPIASEIVRTVQGARGIDPYSVQLGAMAVWEHLHGGTQTKSSAEVTQSQIADIVGQGHGGIVDRIRQDPMRWELLQLLALYPSGLTLHEIDRQLHSKAGISYSEAESAVADLMSSTGYRLLTALDTQPQSYSISHDLFREYILEHVPEAVRSVEAARKTLNDGIWRYKTHPNGFLIHEELETLWGFRAQLHFPNESWKVILTSELKEAPVANVLRWVKEYSSETHPLTTDETPISAFMLIQARWTMVRTFVLSDTGPLSEFIRDHFRLFENPVRAALLLTSADKPDAAIPLLVELVRQYPNPTSINAIEALADLSEIGLDALGVVAANSEDAHLRLNVANVLQQTDRKDLATAILSDLIINQDLEVSIQAVRYLGEMGQSALPVLAVFAGARPPKVVDTNLLLHIALALINLGRNEDALKVLQQYAPIPQLDNQQTLITWQNADTAILAELACAAATDLGKTIVALLAEHGEIEARHLFHVARQARHFEVRMEAVNKLSPLDMHSAMVALIESTKLMAHSPHHVVRQAGAKVLGYLSAPSTLSNMVSVIASSVRTLDNADKPLGLEQLLLRLQEAGAAMRPGIQLTATEALTMFGPEAVPMLSEALASRDDQVRLKASVALGKLGQVDEAVLVLVDIATNSQNFSVGWNAAMALASLGKLEKAIPSLIRLALNVGPTSTTIRGWAGSDNMPDPYSFEHGRILRDLEKLGTMAQPVLTELAYKSDSARAQQEAIQLLQRIGDSAIPELERIANSAGHANTRQAAAVALAKLDQWELAIPLLSATIHLYPIADINWEVLRVLSDRISAESMIPLILEKVWPNPLQDDGITAMSLLFRLVRGSIHGSGNEAVG